MRSRFILSALLFLALSLVAVEVRQVSGYQEVVPIPSTKQDVERQFGQSQDKFSSYQGIVPIHSTKQDVERQFGQSQDGYGYAYETKDERIFFSYQTPTCNCESEECKSSFGQWNVPYGTVLGITVYPKNPKPLESLSLNLGKYKITHTCIPGSYLYTNEEVGIYLAVDQGLVSGYNYFPASSNVHLRCPKRNS